MKIAKDGINSSVRVGYDGKVCKTFHGTDAEKRFTAELRVLTELEHRGCDFVPRVLEIDEKSFTIVTTNCGLPARDLTEKQVAAIFTTLKDDFGVAHQEPSLDNLTFDEPRGRFCVINLGEAEILGLPVPVKTVKTLSWAGTTEAGRRKGANEDSIAVFSFLNGWANPEPMLGTCEFDDCGLVFIISDGMGGHSGGAVASALVISQMQKLLPASIANGRSPSSPAQLLEKSIQKTHRHVLRISEGNYEVDDMGATLVCALFTRGELHFGHVGDSRLYRFRDGRLKQLTDDHSFVGKLQQEGKINEREARSNARRNILTQAIGAQCPSITPQIGTSNVAPSDWFLICSDGVVDGLWDKHIEQEFLMAELTHATPKSVADNLLAKSYREAGNDDTTLFVIKAE